MIKVHGDFNGLFGDLLCLSHSETATSSTGETVALQEGMEIVAFEPDEEDGQRCYLVAKGRVVRSPDSLQHRGSRWSLEIDAAGVRHVPSLDDA
jgi:hypothetical protein